MNTRSIRSIVLNPRGGMLAVVAAAVLAGPVSGVRPAAAAGDCTVTAAQIATDGEESALFADINSFRQANGRAPFTQDATLNKAAAWASQDSARRGVAPSDHIDTLGRPIGPRLTDCGYPAATAGAYGENNYYGGGGTNAQSGFQWGSRQDALNFWSVRSQPHKEALLNPNFHFIGVARECLNNLCFFTLDFGGVAGPAQPPPPPPPAGGQTPAASWPLVRQGATGEAVYSLQYLQQQQGQTLEVDGIFGPQTAQAVRAFQQAHQLSVDGIVGPQTWGALTMMVRDGSQGGAVRAVQHQLNTRGNSLAVDGIFGPLTDSAVRAYQQQRGLAVDGIVGPQTWQALINGR